MPALVHGSAQVGVILVVKAVDLLSGLMLLPDAVKRRRKVRSHFAQPAVESHNH